MRRIELPARWVTTTCLSIRLHPPGGRFAPKCIREVLTLRLPRCERGALPLSYGCVECVEGPTRSGSVGKLGSSTRPSALSALCRPASCRARPSAVSERRRHRLTPGRGSPCGHRAFRKPDLRRADALPLSYVSEVVMGGFDPPPRAFQARALPTELHDHGAGPGARTRINWVTKPVPIPLGPAGTSGAALITPRHPGTVVLPDPRDEAAAVQDPASPLPRVAPPYRRSAPRCSR
jgi:hypothetical protein